MEPLEILSYEVCGIKWAMKALRLPKESYSDSLFKPGYVGPKDAVLSSNFVATGHKRSELTRGIVVWLEIKFHVSWLIHLQTYFHGVECLGSSKGLDKELHDIREKFISFDHREKFISFGQPDKMYKRILTINYAALRRMYMTRRFYSRQDFNIFCNWIETLPYFQQLIYPEYGKEKDENNMG